MNWLEYDILELIYSGKANDRKSLCGLSGHSSLMVERALEALIKEGFLTKNLEVTEYAKSEFVSHAPANAIILAAGFGMRMVPINLTTPKALLEVAGEPLIERLIRQLHEAGITDITVVTGFMKESFEYLKDNFKKIFLLSSLYSRKAIKNILISASFFHSFLFLPKQKIYTMLRLQCSSIITNAMNIKTKIGTILFMT